MVETTKLNQTQIHLLNMFQYLSTDNHLLELKDVLKSFYSNKVDSIADKLWDEKELNNDKLEELLNTHIERN